MCTKTQYLIICKQITFNFFQNEITYKSYMYIHLTVHKQMTDVKLYNIRGAYDKFPDFFSYGHLKLA